MTKSIKIGLILIGFYFLGVGAAGAQDNCAVNLKRAQDLLSSGKVEEIPSLIESCLSKGFTQEEKILAYKVLINAYIFDDNQEKAEQVMLGFLKTYPEYSVISTDPSEFVSLMDRFDNKPRFSFGIIAGGTYSVIRVSEAVNTSPIAGNFGSYPTSGVGFHAGLTLSKYLSPKIQLSLEADVKNTVFDYYIDPDKFTSNSYYESQMLINFPVSATYSFGDYKYTPYARLGVNTGLLIISGADLITIPGTESPRIGNLANRNPFCMWGIIGGGVKLNLSKSFIFLDVRYNLALTQEVNDKGRNLTQTDELWLYQTRDDSFYHDDINFSLGFVKTFYNPRKK